MTTGANNFASEGPIFQQLASRIADDIVSGTFAEEDALPSANDYAIFYKMNPATAGRSMNLLVDMGAIYKKRGIGMFVSKGSRELLVRMRQSSFDERHIGPLLREARVIGLDTDEVIRRIREQDGRK